MHHSRSIHPPWLPKWKVRLLALLLTYKNPVSYSSTELWFWITRITCCLVSETSMEESYACVFGKEVSAWKKMALTGKRQADTVKRRRCTRVPRSCQQKTWSPRSCFIHCIMLSHSARPRRHAVQEVFLRQREREFNKQKLWGERMVQSSVPELCEKSEWRTQQQHLL